MIKRNIIYYVVLILFLLLALYSSNIAFYIITYTMLLLPVSSFLHLIIILLRISYQEKLDRDQILRGEALNYTLEICNRDVIFYPDIKVNYDDKNYFYTDLQEIQTFFIGPLGKQVIQKSIICPHIGTYELGIQSIEISDFFGFFKFVRKIKKPGAKVIVLPRIAELTTFGGVSPNRGEMFQTGGRGNVEDYSELEEIRKFTPGLPLKSVHWKLSAKRNELMARKFAVQQSRQLYLYADVGAFKADDEDSLYKRDAIIETTLSIAKYCLYKAIPTMICFNDPAMTNVKVENKQDFNIVYGKLFQMTLQHGLPLANMIKLNVDQHINTRDVVVLTDSLDEPIFDSLVKMKLSQKNLGFVYLNDKKAEESTDVEERLKTLKDYRIRTFKIKNADEIKEVLENQV